MTEVAALGETYEAALARVHHLQEQASSAQMLLHERLTQGNTRIEALRQTQYAVLEHLGALQHLLQGAQERLAGPHVEAVASLEQVESTAAAQGTRLTESWEHLESAASALHGAVQSGQQALQASLEEGRQGFPQGGTTITELQQQIRDTQEAMHNTCVALTGHLEQAQQQAEAAHEAATHTLSRVAAHLTDLQRVQLPGLFDTLGTYLEQRQRELIEHLGLSADTLEQCCQQWQDQGTEAARRFSDQVSTILHELEQYCADRLQQELEHGVQAIIKAAVDALLEEIEETTLVMTFGSTLTTAMSPYLPELAAAKALVTTINHVLELQDKLTGGLLGG
jgi:hypothetical protein